ncbi:odorant receptor 82a-like, partial [Fopius arisanus]|uniref:Odorant receptor 82a-like n=1 Tax=Fopius arisanus TaxID=64838 RepID=A0A9R1TG07_9HYME
LLTYFTLLMSLTFNIFVFCFIGELLKEQWNDTGKSAYMVDWHRMSPRIAATMMLIIATAQVPKKITAGGLLDLTYASFTSVLHLQSILHPSFNFDTFSGDEIISHIP